MATRSRAVRASPPLAPERLQLVLELGRRVTSLLDLQRLLPEACRLIAESFGYDLVGLNLLDPLDEQPQLVGRDGTFRHVPESPVFDV